MTRRANEGLTLQKIVDAEPGVKIVYADSSNQDPGTMSEARLAYERGFCELVQRRLADGLFEYIAVRRKQVTAPTMR